MIHKDPMTLFRRSTLASLLLATTALSSLSACAPLLIGGAALGGAVMFTDRRTSGTQLEDQGIEIKAVSRVSAVAGNRGHVNVTSYNRVVLLTGEVPTEADKAGIESAMAKVDNVRSVVNELAVIGDSSLASRSSDTIITSKVKAAFIDTKDLPVSAIKVVTERGVVYLMGRLTEREATHAADLARAVGGVLKVVKVFETVSEDELKKMSSS
jgi:osmotically-inducible protein OsmY